MPCITYIGGSTPAESRDSVKQILLDLVADADTGEDAMRGGCVIFECGTAAGKDARSFSHQGGRVWHHANHAALRWQDLKRDDITIDRLFSL